MPAYAEFALVQFADGIVTIGMQPPTAIGGWDIRFQITRRQGGESGLITKTCASGYGGGQSGITVTNSGQGVFNVAIWSADGSGSMDPGLYALKVERLNSGSRTMTTQGWFTRLP